MTKATCDRMPRKTKHKACVACGRTAEVGVSTSFYVLESSPQRKGTLPARGFCAGCFVRRLEKEGVAAEVVSAIGLQVKPRRRATAQGRHRT